MNHNYSLKSPIQTSFLGIPMKKHHKIEAAGAEVLLPEAIIQRIQSLLNREQAAQTTILSKSWYSAWSTRPNLDFDQHHFGGDLYNCGDEDRFWESAKKTMQRYEELNLKIESLRLCMETTIRDRSFLSKELIVKGLKMGAIVVNFELQSQNPKFILPSEVLESESLTGLSVIGCRIDRVADGKVYCPRLKTLNLCKVFIEGDMIWDIILSCPLIEKLILSECKWLSKVQQSIVFRTFMFRRRNVRSDVINLYEFHKLKCLWLEMVNIDAVFFNDFSSKLPCLKDLSLHYCHCNQTIRVSSTSLECISLAHHSRFKANFDVPSIRNFTFSGFGTIPSVSFQGTSSEWESDISINWLGYEIMTSWFFNLRTFLQNLSLSKVSHSLTIGSFPHTIDHARVIQSVHKPVVENLMLSFYELSAAFLNGLFLTCRPEFITLCCLRKSCVGLVRKANREFLQLLSQTLVQGISENCYIPKKKYDLSAWSQGSKYGTS